jgi:hypothetical protein
LKEVVVVALEIKEAHSDQCVEEITDCARMQADLCAEFSAGKALIAGLVNTHSTAVRRTLEDQKAKAVWKWDWGRAASW